MSSIKIVKVPVTLSIQEDVADIVARGEFSGIFSSHGAELKLKTLKEAGITPRSVAAYFMNLQVLTCAFAQDKRLINGGALRKYGFRFSELRNLYLPSITATILSQVGDVQIGSYMVEVSVPADGKVDRDFVIKMSEALYENRNILYAQRDQIGVVNANINPEFMANIVLAMDRSERVATVQSKDGTNPDVKFKALAVCAGICLVNASMQILYPVIDYVAYGDTTGYLEIGKPTTY